MHQKLKGTLKPEVLTLYMYMQPRDAGSSIPTRYTLYEVRESLCALWMQVHDNPRVLPETLHLFTLK